MCVTWHFTQIEVENEPPPIRGQQDFNITNK